MRGNGAAERQRTMEKKLEIGSHILFIDAHGEAHNALATCVFPGFKGSMGEQPGCNVLFVVSEPDKQDPYGRQIKRATSVVHKSWQPAHGNFWCWPDEWDAGVIVG